MVGENIFFNISGINSIMIRFINSCLIGMDTLILEVIKFEIVNGI